MDPFRFAHNGLKWALPCSLSAMDHFLLVFGHFSSFIQCQHGPRLVGGQRECVPGSALLDPQLPHRDPALPDLGLLQLPNCATVAEEAADDHER